MYSFIVRQFYSFLFYNFIIFGEYFEKKKNIWILRDISHERKINIKRFSNEMFFANTKDKIQWSALLEEISE